MKKIGLYVVAGMIGLLVVVGVSVAVVYFAVPKAQHTSSSTEAGSGSAVELTKENVLALKPFVTNLGDTDRPRYINVTFELVAKDATDKSKLEENTAAIRDTILSVLGTKKSLDVAGEKGASTLKSEVQSKLNSLLRKNYVQQVLITDLVVQY